MAFYARQNAITPMLLSGLATLIFAGLAWALARPLGAPGIALANSVAFTTEALVLWWLHHRRMPGVLQVGDTLRRALPAALLGGLVVYGVLRLPLPVPGLVLGLGGLAGWWGGGAAVHLEGDHGCWHDFRRLEVARRCETARPTFWVG